MKHEAVIVDTETTGLINSEAINLDDQPRVIELGMIRIDCGTLDVIDSYTQLIDPEQKLDDKITEITGLTDDDLKGKPVFIEVIADAAQFVLGADTLIAHNLAFDRDIIKFELMRYGMECRFPWPPHHLCTAEVSKLVSPQGKYMRLEELHEYFFKQNPNQTHRALDDCNLLRQVLGELKLKGSLDD